MSQLLLITITGQDQPGITATIAKTIGEYKTIQMVDMAQSIIHGLLSLTIVVKGQSKENLKEELSTRCNSINMSVSFKEISHELEIKSNGEKYILSCVAQSDLSADFIAEISSNLASNKINIQRLDKTSTSFNTLEISTLAQAENLDWDQIKQDLMSISSKYSVDMALIKDDIWRTNKRLIVFDMDSTLIQSEVIVEMAKVHGVGNQVHEITELAMNGKIDFDESLKRRVALLKGLEESKLQSILSKIKLTDGVPDFIQKVQNIGYKTAIISGGFQYFANFFKKELNIDYAFANDLVIKDGKLTGEIKGSIVNAEKKAMLLEVLAQQENLKLEQVVAIGDGANDLAMLSKAGLGIAFHAKEIVRKSAQQNMSHGPMTTILHFLGLKE